jgi:transcriptional antiterminator NusG
MAKQWYVLRVQAGREEQVRENLEKRTRAAGLEGSISTILAPSEKVTEIKGGHKMISERKIYPGYLMVEMEMAEETMALVRETPGVGDFLGSGWGPSAKPVPMSSREVEKITAEAEAHEAASLPKIDFDAGDNVRIKEGPFLNFDGTVEEVFPEKGLVKVIVTIFGRATPVELEYWQIERI